MDEEQKKLLEDFREFLDKHLGENERKKAKKAEKILNDWAKDNETIYGNTAASDGKSRERKGY